MGRRSSSETITGIFQAFLAQRTWQQASLAREIGITVETLRKRLLELEEAGMRLESERDGSNVYWSVPRGWFPGAVAFPQESALDLLRELLRLPKTPARARLIEHLLRGIPPSEPLATAATSIVTPSLSEAEAAYLPVVEDALARRIALCMKYQSAHAGSISTRHVSVQRLLPGPPARFVAVCHRENSLKWFRVDGLLNAVLDPGTRFHEGDRDRVEELLATSVDGFHEAEAAEEHVFFVHDPESRWVERSLIPPMSSCAVAGGIRVTARTAGALRIARFVVSLGAAARPETESLRALVLELARGATRNAMQTERPKALSERDVNSRAVTEIGGQRVGRMGER